MSPGDMGHSVARVLSDKGCRVVTMLAGRSLLSKARASRSNMESLLDLQQLVSVSDFIFSIMPPQKAQNFAEEIAVAMSASGKTPVFVDCNAISPDTTLSIAAIIEGAGAKMLNVGIVGPPPGRGSSTKFFASGDDVDMLKFIEGDNIKVIPVNGDLIKASSIKMCYAALTKGMMTLHTSVLVAAELLGVSSEIHNELAQSQKFHWEGMNKRVSMYACDAGRWAGEMDQISDTFDSVGMTPNLHKGAADIFRLLDASPLGAETRETYEKSRTMKQSIEIYAETARALKRKKSHKIN
jgi:3-hydroxyisobutyrate dehydrogenase-like beta-hydroxyacid dehydrogenase